MGSRVPKIQHFKIDPLVLQEVFYSKDDEKICSIAPRALIRTLRANTTSKHLFEASNILDYLHDDDVTPSQTKLVYEKFITSLQKNL